MKKKTRARKKPAYGAKAAKIKAFSKKHPDASPSEIAKRVGCSPSHVTKVLDLGPRDNVTVKMSDYIIIKKMGVKKAQAIIDLLNT